MSRLPAQCENCLSIFTRPTPLRSSHLDVEDDDPTMGAKFSIEKLRQSQEGLRTIPSTVHGAPVSAAVSLQQHLQMALALAMASDN